MESKCLQLMAPTSPPSAGVAQTDQLFWHIVEKGAAKQADQRQHDGTRECSATYLGSELVVKRTRESLRHAKQIESCGQLQGLTCSMLAQGGARGACSHEHQQLLRCPRARGTTGGGLLFSASRRSRGRNRGKEPKEIPHHHWRALSFPRPSLLEVHTASISRLRQGLLTFCLPAPERNEG